MSLMAMLKKGSLSGRATAIPATFATDAPLPLSKVATVATVAVANTKRQAANDPAPDPDRWCWPHSTAMNTSELDQFAARLAQFTDKGATQIEAESLADKLTYRDRDSDDRRLCLECTHLTGYGQSSWRCSNWQAAGVATKARDAQLPGVLVRQLQRCDGFNQLQRTTP